MEQTEVYLVMGVCQSIWGIHDHRSLYCMGYMMAWGHIGAYRDVHGHRVYGSVHENRDIGKYGAYIAMGVFFVCRGIQGHRVHRTKKHTELFRVL